MTSILRRSISTKLVLMVMGTCLVALVIYGAAMLIYDLRSYEDYLVRDLRTQANIMADVNAAALEFDDQANARQNLALLRNRPMIQGAALYRRQGDEFASYANAGVAFNGPATAVFVDKIEVDGDHAKVWQRVIHKGELLGAVYIEARYQARARLLNYLIILGCVMAGSLGLALLIAIYLRGALTRPIFAIIKVARHVMQTRDFTLRAPKYTEDEIGILADAFNDMLGEVERRASALEASNQSLGREMAERHAAEVALRQADRRKDEFLATLAHELRNPLAPLSNGLHILRMATDKPDVAEKARQVMERQLSQMVRLVDDLLDVSRITTGKLAINRKRVDIQSVMRDAIESTSAFIETCKHELKVDMPAVPIYLDADPVRLAQVFSNLLNNAAKYTNPGGEIRFSARLEANALVVVIADNGIGIAPEMLKDIFNMFTQVDQSLERSHAGLGVGLALARHLADLHGYQLTAASPGKGQGSSFSLHIPLPDLPAYEAAEPTSAAPLSANQYRILLADDNVDFATTMSTLLTTLGHEVRVAHSGKDALAIVETFKPEFAFLDIGMPGMNGYDLARQFRQREDMLATVLVAITGWGQESDRQASKAAGFNHHLVKPVELAQVLLILEHDGKAAH